MTRNGPKMCCPFHFESEFTLLFLGRIIGTIPDECAVDAIEMIKTRNEEIEEREKEKENQKANLYIPSTIGTQINLLSVCLWADCAIKAVLKICAILLKYSNFEGFF